MKAPSLSVDEQNRILKLLADNNGIEIDVGLSKLVSNSSNDYDLALTSPNRILATSDKEVKIVGKQGLTIGTGSNGQQPKLYLKGNKATFSDSTTNGLVDEVVFSGSTLDHIVGKSIFRYNNNALSLLGDNTNYFNLSPNVNILGNARVSSTLYLGTGNFGSQASYLKPLELNLQSDANNKTTITPISTTILCSGNGTGFVKVSNPTSSKYTIMRNNGTIDLYNSETSPIITLKDGSYSTILKQTKGAKGNGTGTVSILDITAGHTKFNGDITATGEIRANKVYNAVYNGFGEIFRKPIDEKIEYGDIVCVREDGLVHKVASANDINNIIGVCSNTIGIEMGGKDIPKEEQVEVEMVGQIWVKTDNENIKCGQWVKALPDGKCDITTNRQDRLGITISNVIDNKVRVVYNG